MKIELSRPATAETRALLVNFLISIGAEATAHSGRTLMDHLLGTYDLLASWGCDETTCLAGGLHSIYGTNIFTKVTVASEARPMVSQEVGDNTERLVWLFGVINRPRAIEVGHGINRQTGEAIILGTEDLRSLRLIEAANLLEQGSSLDKWPNIARQAADQIAHPPTHPAHSSASNPL